MNVRTEGQLHRIAKQLELEGARFPYGTFARSCVRAGEGGNKSTIQNLVFKAITLEMIVESIPIERMPGEGHGKRRLVIRFFEKGRDFDDFLSGKRLLEEDSESPPSDEHIGKLIEWIRQRKEALPEDEKNPLRKSVIDKSGISVQGFVLTPRLLDDFRKVNGACATPKKPRIARYLEKKSSIGFRQLYSRFWIHDRTVLGVFIPDDLSGGA